MQTGVAYPVILFLWSLFKLQLASSEEELQTHLISKTSIPQDTNLSTGETKKCLTASETVEGFISAIGFGSLNDTTSIKNDNPCSGGVDNSGDGNTATGWMLAGDSTCVKVLDGLNTFSQSIELCQNQVQLGFDIAYPTVFSAESDSNTLDVVKFLQALKLVGSVWVRPTGIEADQPQCFELDALGSADASEVNGSTTGTEGLWRNADCNLLKGAVCEKPVPVMYKDLIKNQALAKKNLEDLLEAVQTEDQVIKGEVTKMSYGFKLGILQLTERIESEEKMRSNFQKKLEEQRALIEKEKAIRTEQTDQSFILRKQLKIDVTTAVEKKLKAAKLEAEKKYRELEAKLNDLVAKFEKVKNLIEGGRLPKSQSERQNGSKQMKKGE